MSTKVLDPASVDHDAETSSSTYQDYAHHLIRQQFKKLEKLESGVIKDEDPEPLHEMRVAMRRLRTALKIFTSALELPVEINTKQIARTARVLGEVRDLDVLAAELTTRYAPHLSKAEQKKLQQVLKVMQSLRKKAFTKLEKVLHSDRYQTLKQTLRTWLNQPTYTPLAQLPIGQIAPDLLSPLMSQLLLHPAWLVGGTEQSGQVTPNQQLTDPEIASLLDQQAEILHDLRKQMKGVRYQAEFFAPLFDADYNQQIKDFKAIQDLLGQLQDSAVLCEFLEKKLGHDLEKELPTVLERIQQSRLDLWHQWQPIQARYLTAEFRRHLRQQVLNPTS